MLIAFEYGWFGCKVLSEEDISLGTQLGGSNYMGVQNFMPWGGRVLMNNT